MKKKLKFRAWDKNVKKVFYDFQLDSEGNFQEWGVRNHNNQDNNPLLMQYTGLKDKNGKEIYEGDIVEEIYYKYNEETSKHDILIKSGDYSQISWGKIESRQYSMGGSYSHFYTGWVKQEYYGNFPIGECEVIGNIYENPDLTKELKLDKNNREVI
jgi:uncharacterized phage protein (TIGR01671 family)